jgi:hypothetical protein
LCVSDPGFEVDLYVTTTLPDMIYIWRGDLLIARAQSEGRFEVLGEARARRAFPQLGEKLHLLDCLIDLSATGATQKTAEDGDASLYASYSESSRRFALLP